jgi:hypothetical protein
MPNYINFDLNSGKSASTVPTLSDPEAQQRQLLSQILLSKGLQRERPKRWHSALVDALSLYKGSSMAKENAEALKTQQDKDRADMAAMLEGGRPQTWTNPDTGMEKSYGGIEGVIEKGLSIGNPRLLPQLQAMQLEQYKTDADLAQKKALADYELQLENKKKIKLRPEETLYDPGLNQAEYTAPRASKLLPPDEFQQQKELRQAGATQHNMPPLESAESKKIGEGLGKAYTALKDNVIAAYRGKADLAVMRKKLENLPQGATVPWQTAAAGLFDSLGFHEEAIKNLTGLSPQQVADAQSFKSVASDVVMLKLLQQKGPATDSDADRAWATIASMSNVDEANTFIMDLADAHHDRMIQYGQFVEQWRRRPENNGSTDGADYAWYAGEGAKSIFEEPTLKRYSSPKMQVSEASALTPVPSPSPAPQRSSPATSLAGEQPSPAHAGENPIASLLTPTAKARYEWLKQKAGDLMEYGAEVRKNWNSQAKQGKNSDITQADLEYTARLKGITVEEVKRQMGIGR